VISAARASALKIRPSRIRREKPPLDSSGSQVMFI
jgi:hypothetical protein